jgi:hypothetical protein
MTRRSRRSTPPKLELGPTPAREPAAPVHDDDLCHWYYDGGVICAPDGSQDFVTVTTDRGVFDELDAAGGACRECVAMLHA